MRVYSVNGAVTAEFSYLSYRLGIKEGSDRYKEIKQKCSIFYDDLKNILIDDSVKLIELFNGSEFDENTLESLRDDIKSSCWDYRVKFLESCDDLDFKEYLEFSTNCLDIPSDLWREYKIYKTFSAESILDIVMDRLKYRYI